MQVHTGHRATYQSTVLNLKGERSEGVIHCKGSQAGRWTSIWRHFRSTGERREENGLCLNGDGWSHAGEKSHWTGHEIEGGTS